MKIRGHPAPSVGEFANRGGWLTTEGAELRRRPSSECLHVHQVFLGGGFALGRWFPRFGNPPPRSLHRPRGPIGVGFGGSLLGETSSPSTLPSFSVLSGSSSALPPMSCLGIRVRGPGFPKPNPSRPEPIRVDRRFFEPPIILDYGGGSSSPLPPLSRPSPWAASPLPPIRKSGEAVSHRLPIGAEGDGVPIPGTLARRDRLSETHRVPLLRNPPGIGTPADAAGWGARLGTPALPPPRPAVRRWPPPSPSGAVRNGPYRTLFCFFPLRGGGRSEIVPSSAFAVPRSVGSGKLGGGHDRTETGPISVLQRRGRPPVGPSLSLVSPHVGGASLAHRSAPLSPLR